MWLVIRCLYLREPARTSPSPFSWTRSPGTCRHHPAVALHYLGALGSSSAPPSRSPRISGMAIEEYRPVEMTMSGRPRREWLATDGRLKVKPRMMVMALRTPRELRNGSFVLGRTFLRVVRGGEGEVDKIEMCSGIVSQKFGLRCSLRTVSGRHFNFRPSSSRVKNVCASSS